MWPVSMKERVQRCFSMGSVKSCAVRGSMARAPPRVRDAPAHQMWLLLFLGGQLVSAVLPTTSPHRVPGLLQETLSPLSAPLHCQTSSLGGHRDEMGDSHPPQCANEEEPGEPGLGAAHNLCRSPSFLLPEDWTGSTLQGDQGPPKIAP